MATTINKTNETMNNNTEKEMSIMKTTNTETNKTTTTEIKEESTMRTLLEETIKRIETITKIQDENYVTKNELADILEQLTGIHPSKKVTRKQMIIELNTLHENSKQMNCQVENDCCNEDGVIVSTGDMSEDKYYPELQEENKVTIDKKHGDYLVKNIIKASFVATKGDSKGKRIITMHKLFGIVKAAYGNNNEPVDEAFIKDIVNQLVTLKYITFKKYESGAMMFYPTAKAYEYVKNHK